MHQQRIHHLEQPPKMGAQPSTEMADGDGEEEDIFPSIKRGHSSFLVSEPRGHNEWVGGVVDGRSVCHE